MNGEISMNTNRFIVVHSSQERLLETSAIFEVQNHGWEKVFYFERL